MAQMAGGIGDFNVSAGKDLSGNRGSQARSDESVRQTGSKPVTKRIPGQGNAHYVLIMNEGWDQKGPLKFHNGYLNELKEDFQLTAQVPLPEMPNFFPSDAAGEMTFHGRNVLHLDNALREQPLFAHLEVLRDLVQRVAERKITFPDFVTGLNAISIPASWRNEIVNGLFDHADLGTEMAQEPKLPGMSSDIDRLMEMINQDTSGGSKLSPHLGKFLEEVGRESTGFTLKDGAAKRLQSELGQTLESLRGSLLRHGALANALAFLSSMQRLARAAKGRDRQLVHLWSGIPEDPRSLLIGENADEGGDHAVAIVISDLQQRNPTFIIQVIGLAASLDCPLLVQLSGDTLPPGEFLESLAATGQGHRIYLFAGGVASRVEGENSVFRPAALAFLEGLVASRENVDYFAHRSLVLEDQDLVTEKGQAWTTDKLLDMSQINELSAKGINRVNGARNRTDASFPLLRAWEDS